MADENIKLPREEKAVAKKTQKQRAKIKKLESDQKIHDVEIERMKWRNRRKMAWVALISMVVLTSVLLFGDISESRLSTLKEPITWFYMAMASVIGAYMGFTTWASKKGR